MSRYLLDNLKPLLAIRDAIDQLEGIGRADTSKHFAHTVADEHLCRLVDLRNGNGVLEIPEEANRHLGKLVRLTAHDVQIPSEEALLGDDDLPTEVQDALSQPTLRAYTAPSSTPQIGREPEPSAGSPDASVSTTQVTRNPVELDDRGQVREGDYPDEEDDGDEDGDDYEEDDNPANQVPR